MIVMTRIEATTDRDVFIRLNQEAARIGLRYWLRGKKNTLFFLLAAIVTSYLWRSVSSGSSEQLGPVLPVLFGAFLVYLLYLVVFGLVQYRKMSNFVSQVAQQQDLSEYDFTLEFDEERISIQTRNNRMESRWGDLSWYVLMPHTLHLFKDRSHWIFLAREYLGDENFDRVVELVRTEIRKGETMPR